MTEWSSDHLAGYQDNGMLLGMEGVTMVVVTETGHRRRCEESGSISRT